MPMRKIPPSVPLFILIALTRLFGLLRTVYLSGVWGSTKEAAAFELAVTVSAFLYDTFISTVIASMFIPAYVHRDHLAPDKRDRFLSSEIVPVFLAGLILYLPLLLFPKGILSLCLPEHNSALIMATAPALRIQSLGRVTLSLSSLFVGVLQAENGSVTAALLYCLSSLFSLLSSIALSDLITAFSLSVILALLDLLLLAALVGLLGRRHKLSLAVPPRFRFSGRSLIRAVWVVLSGTFIPILTLFTALSSAELAGSVGVSLNAYAGRLTLLTAALLISVTHATYYAAMARSRNKIKTLRPIFFSLLVISALISALMIVFSPLIVRILYRGNAFSESDLHRIATMLSLYAPSVIALTLSSLLSDFAYLRNQTPHIAIGNLLAILSVGILHTLFGIRSLLSIPFYFTLAAFLRLAFAVMTVASKPIHSKPRILLVLSDRNIGGAGRWLLTYLKNADRDAFDIHVALPKHAALKNEILTLGYPVWDLGTDRSFSLTNTLSAIRLILKLRPDLVNTSASLSSRLAAFLLRVPVRLYTRHCVYPPSSLYRLTPVRWASRLFSQLLSPRAVAVAFAAKHNLVAMGRDSNRITVIENGVAPIGRNADLGRQVREYYRIPNEPVAVICVRLEKDKDVATLIRALSLLKERNTPYHALIVGTGSEQQALRSLANALNVTDRAHFCGFVSDVTPFLNAADLYVNCSVGSEATSLAIAEAMSLSLPVIATDYGGNPSMVTDGYNGILVKQSSASELADAMMILSDPALQKSFGKASFARFSAFYRADTMAKRYESLYLNLLQQKGYESL